ncbi:MAG: DegV family protein [Oscillospiraceae bacterium]|nr:DegV family protein [Oscillospiraceae bacterium]
MDSTADLMPEIKERVHVVPLTVHFGDEEYIDGVTIDHKTFYEKLIESDVLPITVQFKPRYFSWPITFKSLSISYGVADDMISPLGSSAQR